MPECRKSWKVIRCVSLRSSPWNVISFATKPHASYSCVCTLSQRNTRCLVLYVSNLFDLFYANDHGHRPSLPHARGASSISSLQTMVSFATGNGSSFTSSCTFPLENTCFFVLRVCNLRGVCSQCVAANEPYTHPSFFHCGLSSLLRQMTTLLIHLHTHFHGEICIAL